MHTSICMFMSVDLAFVKRHIMSICCLSTMRHFWCLYFYCIPFHATHLCLHFALENCTEDAYKYFFMDLNLFNVHRFNFIWNFFLLQTLLNIFFRISMFEIVFLASLFYTIQCGYGHVCSSAHHMAFGFFRS